MKVNQGLLSVITIPRASSSRMAIHLSRGVGLFVAMAIQWAKAQAGRFARAS